MSELTITPKGGSVELTIAAKETPEASSAPNQFNFGAGWDTTAGEADLDLCAVMHRGRGSSPTNDDLIYYGNLTGPGITHTGDNTTGEGEGDDENVRFNLADIPADVDAVSIGIVAYSATNFANVDNIHLEGRAGPDENGSGLFGADFTETGENTCLVAARLERQSNGEWNVVNVSEFSNPGNGSAAITGFATAAASLYS